jgi:hypothetical protein
MEVPAPQPGTRQIYLCCQETPHLEVPANFSFRCLKSSLEARRSRWLKTIQATTGSSSRTTMWIAGESSDCIVYPRSDSPVRDLELILHQIAHMLLGHRGKQLSDPTLAMLLFPEVDETLTIGVLNGWDMSCAVADGDEEHAAVALACDLVGRGGALGTDGPVAA